MNGAALIAMIRTATMIPSSMVTDAEILRWINEGYFRTAAMRPWPWLEQSGEFETVADQQAYPLATAIVDDVDPEEPAVPVARTVRRIVAIYDDTRRVRLRQWDATLAVDTFGDEWPSSAHATAFFIWADSLYLIPVPSEDDILYRVLLHKAPAALTLATDPDFDEMFHPCLAHYGEFRMWQREEDFEKATSAYAHYLDMVENMGEWYRSRFGDSPWQIGVPQQPRVWTNTPFLDGLS